MAVVANIAVNLDASKALSGVNALDKAVSGLSSGVDKAAKGQNVFNQSVANTEEAIKKQIKVLQETKSKLDINSQAYRDVTATITQYEQKLRTAGTANKTFAEQIQGVGQKVSSVGQAMSGLAGIAAGIGAGAAVSGFVKAGIEADRTAKTIKALSGQYKETAGVTKLANDAAKQYGLGQTTAAKAVADLYGRLRPMGVSLENIGKTFNGVNKAAALMNLSAEDTEGVMLQLSQAMGSGALQGDELRSIMERLPAVGQAVAKVMGVTVGEVKQLGADGKITTDVIIKAMEQLNKIQAPPPDSYKLFQAALEDLQTAIGTQLLPIFTPLVQKLSEVIAKFKELGVGATIAETLKPLGDVMILLLNAFVKLPEPVQKVAIAIGAIAIAFGLVAAPIGIVLQGLGGIIQFLPAIIPAFTKIGTAVGGLGPILATVGKLVVAFFSGPAGWIALAVAAGIAIYAFRDQIGDAFKKIGGWFKDLIGGFDIFVKEAGKAATSFIASFFKPITDNWEKILDAIKTGARFVFDFLTKPYRDAWAFISKTFIEPTKAAFPKIVEFIKGISTKITDAITAPFKSAVTAIKGVFNNLIGIIERSLNVAIDGINRLISAANKLPGPDLPLVPKLKLPRFAEGGVVTRPTLALVGEGGEPEYIVPQSKADAFAQNWISGRQGASAIPSASSSGGGSTVPSINIQTGPVTQMAGTKYVTMGDLESALQTMAIALANTNRSAGARRYAGVR